MSIKKFLRSLPCLLRTRLWGPRTHAIRFFHLMAEGFLDEIEAWVREGLGGSLLVRRYTALVDDMIRSIFDSAGGGTATVMIATGGYGRGELAPYSDVDVMFFARDRSDTSASERILYKLWDTKLDISHSFRTASECIEEAGRDVRTRTSLLEARYIAGSRDLYDLFVQKVYPEMVSRKKKDFLRDKLKEMEKRHLTGGDSVFLLEPNVKEGEGGLRDVHTAYWLSKVVLKAEDFSAFLGLMAFHDRRRFSRAYDFLLRARYCLHIESRRRNDILSLEYQKNVSQRLGFRDSGRFTASERMLRYYYLQSRIIKEVARKIVVRCSKPYVPFFRSFTVRRLSDEFSVSGGRLIATKEKLFALTPERIMRGFYLYSKTGSKFSDVLKERVQANLLKINRNTRSSPDAVQDFLDILKGGRVYETLREMHEMGVLGRFLPEFGALSLRVVHEPYHMYTVDEHTLRAVRNLEALRTGRYKHIEDLHELFHETDEHEVLFMALLFHDIGKAAGRHHEEEGYKRLKRIMERFNLDIRKRAKVEFLVKNHILMSRIALKREPGDPEVIAQFSDAVGDHENLKALYLVTYADMSAVNPGFWNSWKAYLLRELYVNTRNHLSGVREDRDEYLRRLAGDLSADLDGQVFRDFLDEMPERYLLFRTKDRIIDDFRLFREAEEKAFAMRIDSGSDAAVEISVCAADAPGLFSKIVGFLSSKGMNIVNGRIFTGRGGYVIDNISVSNWKDLWWEGLPGDLESGLRRIVVDREPVTVGGSKNKKGSPFDVFIELDNETSHEFSLIEIFCPDRIGLLYEMADVMYRAGIDIFSARINTQAGLAQDVFYVRAGEEKLSYMNAEEVLSDLWSTLTK